MNCDRCIHCFEDRLIWAVEALRDKGAKVRIRRRKLTNRRKTYLRIVAEGGHWEWKNIVMPAIYRFFPDAYMTSGSFGLPMDITVALGK
jgi:hypothetical protein